MLLHKTADTEFFGVKSFDQLPHPLRPFLEGAAPRAELFGAQIVLLKSLGHRVSGANPHFQGEVDTGGVNRIDEAECITGQNPAVARVRLRHIRKLFRRFDTSDLCRSIEASPQTWALFQFFKVNLFRLASSL